MPIVFAMEIYPLIVLCISTSKQVLRMLLVGQNCLFQGFNIFFSPKWKKNKNRKKIVWEISYPPMNGASLGSYFKVQSSGMDRGLSIDA